MSFIPGLSDMMRTAGFLRSETSPPPAISTPVAPHAEIPPEEHFEGPLLPPSTETPEASSSTTTTTTTSSTSSSSSTPPVTVSAERNLTEAEAVRRAVEASLKDVETQKAVLEETPDEVFGSLEPKIEKTEDKEATIDEVALPSETEVSTTTTTSTASSTSADPVNPEEFMTEEEALQQAVEASLKGSEEEKVEEKKSEKPSVSSSAPAATLPAVRLHKKERKKLEKKEHKKARVEAQIAKLLRPAPAPTESLEASFKAAAKLYKTSISTHHHKKHK